MKAVLVLVMIVILGSCATVLEEARQKGCREEQDREDPIIKMGCNDIGDSVSAVARDIKIAKEVVTTVIRAYLPVTEEHLPSHLGEDSNLCELEQRRICTKLQGCFCAD